MPLKKINFHISAHIHPFDELMAGAWWCTLSAQFQSSQPCFFGWKPKPYCHAGLVLTWLMMANSFF
jgi:hypothetical protein